MIVARRQVKLAVLGQSPRYFDAEQVTTVEQLLLLAEIPKKGYDVRLNGLLFGTSEAEAMTLQEGDMVVCVPKIEGGR